MKLSRLFRKLFYRLFIICYLTRKDEIFSTKVFALNAENAIKKFRKESKYDHKILAITKLKKDIGELL